VLCRGVAVLFENIGKFIDGLVLSSSNPNFSRNFIGFWGTQNLTGMSRKLWWKYWIVGNVGKHLLLETVLIFQKLPRKTRENSINNNLWTLQWGSIFYGWIKRTAKKMENGKGKYCSKVKFGNLSRTNLRMKGEICEKFFVCLVWIFP
jgi:hypothetical protein